MDKQQYSYHLLSYDIILINFPQPPQTPKKRWNEISQMPMNHPHLHSLPQCLKLLHWSELRGPMNCQANGTTCRGTVLQGTLRKNQPASSSGFMAFQRKIWENIFDVFVLQWCFFAMIFSQSSREFPLRTWEVTELTYAYIQVSGFQIKPPHKKFFASPPRMKHLHHKRTIPSKKLQITPNANLL